MSDLRRQVVEAMAQAIHEARSFHSKDMHGTCRLFAEAALDASLDVLGERREEWLSLTRKANFHDVSIRLHPGLLAVLRDSGKP